MFSQDFSLHREEAAKALNSIQAERGAEAVQVASIVDDPSPTKRFCLIPWNGLMESREWKEGSPTVAKRLARRVLLDPRTLPGIPRRVSRFAYSGGWWNRPYHYELGYAQIGPRWCWIQRDKSESWSLIGWVD
jgi:hypothetical protein